MPVNLDHAICATCIVDSFPCILVAAAGLQSARRFEGLCKVTVRLTLLATGDVAPRRSTPSAMFDGVRTTLATGDIVFGQLETTISARGTPSPQAKLAMRTDPSAALAIREAGFHVMSFAGNHCLDWGRDAFADTLAHARNAGLQVCGAGPTRATAREPALIEVNGTRVAFVAYSSILPQGYAAQSDRPGCAPMRALTVYEQIEIDQPGTPARMHTFAHREDLQALREDVRAAKARADFVALSIHWGVHFVPAEIADYQRDIAYAAIDDGCDAVLGHHPHILKGIEIYKGRPIFYSLGNFAIEQPQAFDETILESQSFAEISALNSRFDRKRAYVAPPDTQKTMIAKLVIEDRRLSRIAIIPAQIADTAEPSVLMPDDPRFAEIGAYLTTISRSQNLSTRFSTSGAEIELGS
jgi:poly-gamma-glutamate synthesis protein (capsule biosynthesis protein)